MNTKTLVQACISLSRLFITQISTQQMSAIGNELSLTEEVDKMAAVCGEEKGKRLKDMLSSLLKKARGGDQNTKEITIYFCPTGSKDSGSYDRTFLLCCLLFIFIRYRNIKLKVVPSIQSSPKVKKPDVLLKCRHSDSQQFRVSKHFHQYADKVIQQSICELGEGGLHYEQISIQCAGDSIVGQIDLLQRREHAFEFLYHFFDGLREIIGERKMFLLKNSLSLSCRKETLANIPNADMHLYAEEAWTKKIVKMQENLYVTALIVKTRTQTPVEDFTPQQKQEDQQLEIQSEENKQKMGFFGGFSGSQCQYISRLILQFSTVTLTPLEKLLPRLPNLSHLRITKAFQQANLPSADGFLHTLTHHNQLIQLLWLSNIKVNNVELQVLQGLYDECPYLSDLQLGLPERYFSREGTEEVKECGTLLSALHLRKVSLLHNLEMAKLLIAKEYNINEVIEIVDTVEPFVF